MARYFIRGGEYFETLTDVVEWEDSREVVTQRPSIDHVWNGSDWDYVEPTPPTIEEQRAEMVCSPAQMRLALAGAGMLAEVNAAAAADQNAAVVWEYATRIERNSDFIAALSAEFTNPSTGQTITAEEIDALFTAAMAISI